MSEWQPIETAPKYGSEFLAIRRGGHIIARWDDDRHSNRPRPYWTGTDKQSRGAGYCRTNTPECWMPLPEPPVQP